MRPGGLVSSQCFWWRINLQDSWLCGLQLSLRLLAPWRRVHLLFRISAGLRTITERESLESFAREGFAVPGIFSRRHHPNLIIWYFITISKAGIRVSAWYSKGGGPKNVTKIPNCSSFKELIFGQIFPRRRLNTCRILSKFANVSPLPGKKCVNFSLILWKSCIIFVILEHTKLSKM